MDEKMIEVNKKAEVNHFKSLPVATKIAIAKELPNDIIMAEVTERLEFLQGKEDRHNALGKITR